MEQFSVPAHDTLLHAQTWQFGGQHENTVNVENFSVATLIIVQRVITYRWRDFLLVYLGSGVYYLLKVRYRWNDFMHRL